MERNITVQQRGDHWLGRFGAMASPCEVLLEVATQVEAEPLVQLVAEEAWRIEVKYSRYRDDNPIHQINTGQGQTVSVDAETADLLDFADTCYRLSEGLFDITSGILRKLWRFNADATPPTELQVAELLPYIGWDKVIWQRPQLTLPAGMEIDLGGIGKEYAVDRSAQLLRVQTKLPFLINFGGDLYISGRRLSGEAWRIGIDDPRHTGSGALGTLQVEQGGVATSGDARRFIDYQGVRYSHVLNPKTGWPIVDAPRSVTVVASTCMEAGMLSTFAMLQGTEARAFLESQGVPFWIE